MLIVTVVLAVFILSVAAGAGEVVKTWDELVYMQDMTSAICASQTTPAAGVTTVPTKTLTDSRDGNTYTIAKLKDSNCWMTQNLRLVGDKTLTPEDSDINGEYALPASVVLDSTNDNPKQFSASDQYQSKVYYANSTTNGAYYNWYTATAGTGDASITEDGTNAPSSICPKGWRLPTGGSSGEFYTLLNGLTVSNITSAPYSFVYGGSVYSSSLNNVANYGRYWSSTATTALIAYSLDFTTNVGPSGSNPRFYGLFVRCVAR